MSAVYEVLVLGAGINGLATAYQLSLRRPGRIGLVERFALGHHRGSSHGRSRITRTTYSDPKFARLARVAHGHDWPMLESAAGMELVRRCPGCFFGPGAQTYWEALKDQRQGLELVEAEHARKLFPLFAFPGGEPCILDRTAGVVAAADCMEALHGLVRGQGVEILAETPVTGLDLGSNPIRLETGQGLMRCHRLVLTAGAWSARLLGRGLPLVPVRQNVGYFRLQATAEAVEPGAFPVWAYIGDREDDFYYGLPQFQRPGVKAARHLTGLVADDPDQFPERPDTQALEELREFLAGHFTAPILEIVGSETCLYTNTPRQDFLLDHLPGDSRVVVGAGFSGHGFKFGPLTGRILAGLCLDGATDISAFEEHRADYGFDALKEKK